MPQQIADSLFRGITRLVFLEVQVPFRGGKCHQGSTGLVVYRERTHQV